MLWLDLDFGLLGREYSSERVLVMVVVVCARRGGHVYYNRAFGCCRTLTPLYCFPFHPSFLFFFPFGYFVLLPLLF